ncbi:hypothetical protein RJ55_00341 [Drechmeria coniospora]|nr:hypothetical protein RJ55_00341 [Drechmeria coniospora]
MHPCRPALHDSPPSLPLRIPPRSLHGTHAVALYPLVLPPSTPLFPSLLFSSHLCRTPPLPVESDAATARYRAFVLTAFAARTAGYDTCEPAGQTATASAPSWVKRRARQRNGASFSTRVPQLAWRPPGPALGPTVLGNLPVRASGPTARPQPAMNPRVLGRIDVTPVVELEGF